MKEKYNIADNELTFVKNLQSQVERVNREGELAKLQNGDDEDAGTFMTRISDDKKRNMKASHTQPQTAKAAEEKSLVLPELNNMKEISLDETFESALGPGAAGPKSVASSRNNGRFATAHKRAVSNVNAKKPGNLTSRYRQGMIPTDNLKFNQFLDILFSSRMTRDEIKEEATTYVQVLETNYTDKITQLRVALEKSKKQT